MNKIKGRFLAVILAIALTLPMLLWLPVSVNALEEPTVTNTSAAYLYNLENKKELYKLNADEKLPPTSTVKLMTGIVALEVLRDRLDEKVTVTAEMLADNWGLKFGLKVGESVVIRDMLGAMLVSNANDAAYVLAYTAAGSVDEFVLLMNKRANELGAHNTRYTNPTGKHDEGMYTTAYDTALIALHAYNLEQFMDFAALLKYTVPESNMNPAKTVYNRNSLLSLANPNETDYYYKKARGMNAGSTPEGGYAVVTTASDGEITYLAVVLGAENVDGTIYSYVNAVNLLEWAFNSFIYLDVLSPEQIMSEIPVTLATGVDHVTLVANDSLSVYLPADTDIEKEITYSCTTNTESLQAPVKKGQLAGRVTVLYNGEPIGTADLISTADIERNDVLFALDNISRFTKSPFFIATLVCIIVFSVVYVLGKAFLLKKRSRKRYR